MNDLLTRCRSILVVAPHPDDETLATGGLLGRLIGAGCTVRIVFLTDGERNILARVASERRLTLGSAALHVAVELPSGGELKLPTAHNRLIGTGKTDFTAWAIASKRFGRIDLHGNLEYTIVGKPAGTHLKNIIDYALAEEFHLSPGSTSWERSSETLRPPEKMAGKMPWAHRAFQPRPPAASRPRWWECATT